MKRLHDDDYIIDFDIRTGVSYREKMLTCAMWGNGFMNDVPERKDVMWAMCHIDDDAIFDETAVSFTEVDDFIVWDATNLLDGRR